MIASLLKKLPEKSAAVIVSEENQRYYTRFPVADAVLVIGGGEGVLLTDSRYIHAARSQAQGCRCVELTRLSEQLPQVLRELGCTSALFESSRVTVAQSRRYEAMLDGFALDFSDTLDGLIENQRRIKTPEEVEKICRAQAIAESALEEALNFIRPGKTEKEIALALDFYMLSHGAQELSFQTIAVSGANSALPHGVPTDKPVESGDFITMDFGAVVDSYHSDMTRTVALGKVSDLQKQVYQTVLDAQTACLDGLRAGITGQQGDALARSVIENAGYGARFGHGTGHGVGVEIHEEPRLSPNCTHVLEPGEIVTVEPGIYLNDQFGVRIEDMVWIQKEGIQNLTKAPKNLIVLGS